MITRSEQDARALAGRLESLGAVPIVVPAIRIDFEDPGPLDALLRRLPEFDWIIFTSRNTVEAVCRRGRLAPGPRVAAIGPATAGALRARGIEPDLVPAEHVAEALVSALRDVRGKRFLLPRADIARRELPDTLRAEGAEVEEVVVYRTRPATGPRPDLSGTDAVTFTSPSTVKNFLAGGPVPAGARIVCIGPVTAQTARSLGLDVTEVAGDYTEDGLIAALVSALGR